MFYYSVYHHYCCAILMLHYLMLHFLNLHYLLMHYLMLHYVNVPLFYVALLLLNPLMLHCLMLHYLLLHNSVLYLEKKKKLHDPFLWMGFNCLKATATSRRQFTFYHSVPRNSWYSFYRPRKDERLSRPWSHLVVLNTGLLDWESSALTTILILHY